MKRDELKEYLEDLFSIHLFSDYCPNGLQVQGKEEIKRAAFAVSATRESIKKSVEWKADALLTHHGLFWRFHGVKPLTGPFYQRLAPLIKNDISLFGIHLPLDAHLDLGNAASLGKQLGLLKIESFGDYQGMPTGVKGVFKEKIDSDYLQSILESILGRDVLVARPDGGGKIATIGIITGGANGDWKLAQKEGLHSYLTGEMSEHDWHESKEAGIYMFAGGHHATERFGIQALERHLKEKFQLETSYFDSSNPA